MTVLQIPKISLAFGLAYLLSSCNGNNREGPPIDQSQCNGPKESFISVDDIEHDVEYEFSDIRHISIHQDQDQILVDINLRYLPEVFYYDFGFRNPDGTTGSALEYAWEIYFDIDCDGTELNDIVLGLTRFNNAFRNIKEGVLPNFTQNNIWKVSDGHASNVGDIDVSINDSTISIQASRGAFSDLNIINGATPFKVITFHNETGDGRIDLAPDNGDYITPSETY